MRGPSPIVWVAMIVAIAVAIVFGVDRLIEVKVPVFPKPTQTVWLNQNWSSSQSAWFHHVDQGTSTLVNMPYEWYVALDRPEIFVKSGQRLSDLDYLDRFGFIPDPDSPGPLKIPVGFARGDALADAAGQPWLNPQSGVAFTRVGLSCAACHTGRITYHGREMLIDGGPALTNLDAFSKAVGLSVILTRVVPFRRDEFDARVLGPSASAAAKAALNKQLDTMFETVFSQLISGLKNGSRNVTEGYGRLDALNRIGNQVFSVDLDDKDNYAPTDAPVHFPRIWQSPWFEWVQYDASIQQPMVRNAGEALGVASQIWLTNPNDPFRSSVKVNELYKMESLLAGPPPTAATGFGGLRAPRWSDTALPPIDTALARRGAALYAANCQSCHMAPTSAPAFWTSPRWSAPNATGERFLDLELVGLDHVGTDRAEAESLATRTVKTPPNLGIKPTNFGQALGVLVAKVTARWYANQAPPVAAADQDRMNGFRANGIRAPLAYKVRPLDGIWATPPYLHNGSVPNLYALLSPLAERPTTFYAGAREYDPKVVGYRIEPFPNGFKFDTTLPGNSNKGHLFSNTPGPGVVGPALTPDERWALIEYLKTL